MKKGSLAAKSLGALIGALLFYIIGSGPVYKLTNMVAAKVSKKHPNALAGPCTVGKEANLTRPTKLGRVVHALVFGLVVLALMEL
jgi:hypothetical protein